MKNKNYKSINNRKPSSQIYREVSEVRTQFWCAALEKDGKYAIVTTNLPIKEAWIDDAGQRQVFPIKGTQEERELFTQKYKKVLKPSQCASEKKAIGLQSVWEYANEKGFACKAIKVLIDNINTEKLASVVIHDVEAKPRQKGDGIYFEIERSKFYEGGFPPNTIASDIAEQQLSAFGFDVEGFVGEEKKLTTTADIVARNKQRSNKERLNKNLNSLGAAFDAATKENKD